eukprot:gene23172-30383_t
MKIKDVYMKMEEAARLAFTSCPQFAPRVAPRRTVPEEGQKPSLGPRHSRHTLLIFSSTGRALFAQSVLQTMAIAAAANRTAIMQPRILTSFRPIASTLGNRVLRPRALSSYAPRPRVMVAATAESANERQDFTVTTPLYYVNAAPHMGSAYPTIAADTLARYQRLRGKRVRFVTGTDEHGEKIALAAAARGMSPQEHCDDIVTEYKKLWEQLSISYDHFVRTTEPKHAEMVKEVLDRVWKKGDIYKADYEGWYCVDCEEFKDEKEMDAAHTCPTHRKPCEHRKEGNYFFRLSKYEAEIQALLSENSTFVQPETRRNEVSSSGGGCGVAVHMAVDVLQQWM